MAGSEEADGQEFADADVEKAYWRMLDLAKQGRMATLHAAYEFVLAAARAEGDDDERFVDMDLTLGEYLDHRARHTHRMVRNGGAVRGGE